MIWVFVLSFVPPYCTWITFVRDSERLAGAVANGNNAFVATFPWLDPRSEIICDSHSDSKLSIVHTTTHFSNHFVNISYTTFGWKCRLSRLTRRISGRDLDTNIVRWNLKRRKVHSTHILCSPRWIRQIAFRVWTRIRRRCTFFEIFGLCLKSDIYARPERPQKRWRKQNRRVYQQSVQWVQLVWFPRSFLQAVGDLLATQNRGSCQ